MPALPAVANMLGNSILLFDLFHNEGFDLVACPAKRALREP